MRDSAMTEPQPADNASIGADTPSSLVFYNDNDAYCAQWLRNLGDAGLLPTGTVDERSITDIEPSDLAGYEQCHFFAGIGGWPYALSLAGWGGPVWTGSCPCQPLSSAGLQRGHADERHLWPAFYALIAECRPATVFGEQVASKDGREWLAGIRADLEHLGYAVGCADLSAASVGAPHIRQRLFWVAQSQVIRSEPTRSWEDRGKTAQSGRLRASGGMAESNGSGRQPESHGIRGEFPRNDAGWARVEWFFGTDFVAGGMADAGFAGLEEWASERGNSEPQCQAAERAGDSLSWLGHATLNGCRQSGALARRCASGDRAQGATERPWADNWLDCLDGKARRVEPGIQPLAHGVPNRVGILRGAGNAIVPQVAAEFVKAFIEIAGKSEERTSAHE